MTNSQTSFRPSALKYRPQRLDELVGQEVLVKSLQNSINQDRLAHAYVFTGVRGVGKPQRLDCWHADLIVLVLMGVVAQQAIRVVCVDLAWISSQKNQWMY